MDKATVLKLVGIVVDNILAIGGGAAAAYYFHDAIAKVVGPTIAGIEKAFVSVYSVVKGKKAAAPAAPASK